MKPVTQSRTGEDGTCFRACIASILNLKERDVTDFDKAGDGSDEAYWGAVARFLRKHGLRYRRVPLDGTKPSGYGTIEGVSPRGGLHACVAYNGELVHDPHPQDGTGRGLVEPRYYGVFERLAGQKGIDAVAVPSKLQNKVDRWLELQDEYDLLIAKTAKHERLSAAYQADKIRPELNQLSAELLRRLPSGALRQLRLGHV